MSDVAVVREAIGILEDLHLRDTARRLREVADRMECDADLRVVIQNGTRCTVCQDHPCRCVTRAA